MEFKPEEIAKLVLGYLRENKCQTAFKEFLISSPYLKEHYSNYRRGKYIATRVNGLSLMDYLTEYAVVYSIVQEHIEASDYYNERGLRTSLAQQLLYLLASSTGFRTRTSTPIQEDFIIDVHQTNSIDGSKNSNNNAFDVASATPLQSLPGNSSTEVNFLNSSKSKSANKSIQIEANEDREKSQEMCKEIFTQTFLDNSALIEKLADNINKEVSAKSCSSEEPGNFVTGQELDNTTIETIIQRIAKDPAVVNSIEKIIGCGEDESESSATPEKNVEQHKDKTDLNTSNERCLLSPRKAQNISSESIKTRLRSSKKCYSGGVNDLSLIEDQSNEVVKSIVAVSLSDEKQCLTQEPTVDNISTNIETPTLGEVIVSEQPYDNLVHSGVYAGQSNQNQNVYVNTMNSGGLLMIQPSTSSSCSNIESAKGLQVEPMKPYYIIGSQQFNNVIIPQTPYKVNNVITEQEIMAMPTIIVCDNNQQYTCSQTPIAPASVMTSISTSQNQLRTIAPKKTPAKAQSLSEYITLYQCNDSSSPIISQRQLTTSPPNVKSKPTVNSSATDKSRSKPKADKRTSQRSAAQTSNIQTLPETRSTNGLNNNSNKLQTITENAVSETVSLKIETNSPYHKSSEELEQSQSKSKPLADSMPHIVTPKMMMVQDVKERRSRSTPRNGSHVRQLDFSTPDKWCPTVRRAHTSPKADRALENRETPVKAPKPGTSKSIRTSLFKSPELELPADITPNAVDKDKENDNNKVDAGSNTVPEKVETSSSKSIKSWDADLRALAACTETEEKVVQKQKRKRSEEFVKEHSSSKKPKVNLNKTEEDAMKIENALCNSENQMEIADTAVTKPAQENVKNVKNTKSRRNRVTTKKANSANKVKKNESEKIDRENSSVPTKISSIEDTVLKQENQQKITCETFSEKQYAVINRHVKSRIKKKCNMENPIKKTQMPEEIILTNITKIKSCEIIDDGKNKLILSPSKLNANKRSLVEMENRSPVEISATKNDNHEVTGNKFVTPPELPKSFTNIPPVTAKRNIMPILETPVKCDPVVFPKTPTICSPSAIDTPFTKAVLDQLTGVDINAIPTPRFPITPNVPFTPVTNEQSPFSNRPTDYSTSSSYYQPSDTEQNKSLEQLIEECRKLDSQSTHLSNKVDDCDGKNLERLENSDVTKKTEQLSDVVHTSKSPEVTNTSVTEKMKAFNNSMIGKKNLQLVKMFSNEKEQDESSSSDNSSTETSSTSSSDDSDSSDSDGDVNKTLIKNTPPPYSLRSRKCLTNSKTPDANVSRETVEGKSTTLDKEQHSVKSKEKPLSFQDGLLQEMEEKRLRTIARFKNANVTTKTKDNSKRKKPTPKSKESGKTAVKIDEPSTSKKLTTNKANVKKLSVRKENSALKNSNNQLKNEPDQLKDLKSPNSFSQRNEEECTTQQLHSTVFSATQKAKATINDDKEIILHLSSDDENLEPSKLVEAVLLEYSTSPTGERENVNMQPTASGELKSQEDQETTETWAKLQGLMQMGIHLIPTKPVKKPMMSVEETGQFEKQIKENVSGKNDHSAECNTDNLPNPAPTQDLPEEVLKEKLEKSISPVKNANKSTQAKEKSVDLPNPAPTQDLPEEVLKEKLEKSISPVKHANKSTKVKEKSVNLANPVQTQDLPGEVLNEKLEKSISPVKNANKSTTVIEKSVNLPNLAQTEDLPGVLIEKLEKSTSPVKNTAKSKQSEEKLDRHSLAKEKSKSISEVAAKEKPENLEPKGKIEKARSSRKKSIDKLNCSIEEGEIISDCDSTPKKDNKSKKFKADDAKKVESKSKNSIGKEYTSQQDRSHNFREFYKSRPRAEKQSKDPVSSDKSSSSKSRKHENKISEKTTKSHNKMPEKIKEIKTKSDMTASSQEMVVNELDYQVQFDCRTYTEETYRITHDYSKKPSRTISDYNLDILTKKFAANVYIAEIDSEVEKFLTFTPFELLLDIPPSVLDEEKPVNTSKSGKSNFPKEQLKNKKKPLNILYNQLVKPARDACRSSLLDDLYAPETSRGYKRNFEISQPSKSRKCEKFETSSRSKDKQTIKEKLTEEEQQSHNKSLENTIKHKHRRKTGDEEMANKTDPNLEILSTNEERLKSKSDNSTVETDKVTKPLHHNLKQDLEVVDGVIMLNTSKNEQKTDIFETSFEANDELMNYALVGSERIEDNDDSLSIDNSRKRKVTEEEGENQQEKKQKTEELLRSIDVDSFLKKLHGET